MSWSEHLPGTFCGIRIRDIDIWKKREGDPEGAGGGRLSSPRRDPTANTAIGNVMRGDQALRKRRLMRIIEAERECRRNQKEKEREQQCVKTS